MDWSLFKTPAQHPFLRKDLQYSNYYVSSVPTRHLASANRFWSSSTTLQ